MLHFTFIIRVGKCCCFIKNQNRCVLKKCPRNGKTLCFTARYKYAFTSYYSVYTVGKFSDYIHALCFFQGFHYFIIGGIRFAHSYIFKNTHLK